MGLCVCVCVCVCMCVCVCLVMLPEPCSLAPYPPVLLFPSLSDLQAAEGLSGAAGSLQPHALLLAQVQLNLLVLKGALCARLRRRWHGVRW